MTFLASGAVAVAAHERKRVVTVGFEVSRLAATADEGSATVGTARTVGSSRVPVGGLTLERQLLEHTGTQPIPALIECSFKFSDGGIGMLQAPLAHATEDLVAEGVG